MNAMSQVIILFVALSAGVVRARPGYAVDYYVSVWECLSPIKESNSKDKDIRNWKKILIDTAY